MAGRRKELPIPESATMDPDALELVRVWAAYDTQVVSLRIGVPDAAAWGYTLADVARYIADAYERKSGLDPRATMAAIRSAFLDETAARTAPDRPTGKIQRAKTPKPKRATSRVSTKIR